MGRTPRKRSDHASEIDDLFGGPKAASSDYFEDISIASCVYEPVMVGLKGGKLETRLEKGFYPQYDREIIVKDRAGKTVVIPIEDIHFLAFANRPLQIDISSVNSYSDMIELYNGGLHQIRLPGSQSFEQGLYGVKSTTTDRYRYIFFTFDNIRLRFQRRLIGEIIVEKNILTENTLKNALRRQAQLRKLRIGTIIAKKINRPIPDVENILKRAGKVAAGTTRNHVGDILVAAGLVTPEIVNQSLSFQKHIRNMKLGRLLMEMGYLDENQFYSVLAEKFRKNFINLHGSSPSEDAMRQLPRTLVKQLSVVPVYFRKKRLVIATAHPDRAEINDILRQRLSCPFELVVAPPHQIIDVLANLPQS